MSIGISEEHVELARSLREWAASLGGREAARDADSDAGATFADTWKACVEMGVATIGLPESYGGGGGTVLDSRGRPRGVRARAGARSAALDRGGRRCVAPSARARRGRRRRRGGRALGLAGDLAGATHVLGADGLARAERCDARARRRPDPPPRRRDASGRREPRDLVRRTFVTLAAAEAAGVARWCLETAVDYAKVREQFGQKIGAFQAVKHLCAEMLETCRGRHRGRLGRGVAPPTRPATTSSGPTPPTWPR